ncbi:SHOCT domain-containing protein [Nocardioides silvaticus]|nr:SHOCT domain-containing protein [Nocardioides silvaticus]
MGWFDGFKRIKDPVRGTAQIVSNSAAPQGATSGTCRMHLVVHVPGHPSFPVDDSFMVSVKKWPSPGQSLPIVASQADPRRFKILWDEIQDWNSRASAQAAQIAAAMNQQPPPEGQYQPYEPTQPGTPVVMVNGRPASPEELEQYELMTGMDLDGDGRIAGGAPAGDGLQGLIASAMGGLQPPPPAWSPGERGNDHPGTADDRVAALERLAALRESGALTEEEFAAEKARILDS